MQPFFSMLITITSHGPFDLPKVNRELALSNELDNSRLGGYFQSIHYVDKQIGSFVEGLHTKGLLSNSVIVIYGDHEGVHKYYQNDINRLTSPESWWLDNQYHIPFIIYNSEQKGKTFDVTGGQIDILPTVAYLMGVDEKEYQNTAMGRNLLKTNKNFVILRNGQYVGDKLNQDDVDNALNGVEISNKIIKSDFFKDNIP